MQHEAREQALQLGGRPAPTSAYGLLYDGIPGEGLYPQVYSDVTDEQMRQWEASSFGVHDAGWRETLFP